MSASSYICIGILILLVILFLYFTRTKRSIDKQMSKPLSEYTLDELEKRVFRYEAEYFRLIGEENESVLEFKKIIEDKDISTLYRRCNSLLESFKALEQKAGYDRRPILYDYYFSYENDVRELQKRTQADL